MNLHFIVLTLFHFKKMTLFRFWIILSFQNSVPLDLIHLKTVELSKRKVWKTPMNTIENPQNTNTLFLDALTLPNSFDCYTTHWISFFVILPDTC